MSIFSGLFGRSAGITAPKEPPVPTGEWQLIVDKSGNPVNDRPAAIGDMLARRPVQYHYGGTIPGYKPDKSKSLTENMAARTDYEMRSIENRALLDKAIFLLSQTDDGRRLLNTALSQEFTFVFDPERTQKEGAAGLCDYTNKLIPLNEGSTPEQVALTVKHELQHMEDIKNGAGRYSQQKTVEAATILNRGLEANARVSEAVLAMESMTGSSNGPPTQFRTYALMANFHNKNRHMGAAALNSRKYAEQNTTEGWQKFGNAVFPAYYEESGTLAYYDKRMVKMYNGGSEDMRSEEQLRSDASKDAYYSRDPSRIENFLRTVTDSFQGIMQDAAASAETLQSTLIMKGQTYLNFGKHFDPTSAKATAWTEAGLGALGKLKDRMISFGVETDTLERIKTPEQRKERPLPKGLTGEFAQALQSQQKPKSEPITLPYRIDGDRDTRGTARYEFATSKFKEIYEHMGIQTQSPLDQVEFTVSEYCHKWGSGNIMHNVNTLLEAGLRAPINAFPSDYIFDLASRIQLSADHAISPTQTMTAIKPAEVELIKHWKEMAAEGLNPLWIDKQHADMSFYGREQLKMAYVDIVLNGIGMNPEHAKNIGEKSDDKVTAHI